MGLHLRYTLAARGSDPLTKGLRSDPATLRDLMRMLCAHGLVEDCGVTWLSLVTADSQVLRRDGYTGLDELLGDLEQTGADFPIRVSSLGGLRTGEGFPNPFGEYTRGEASLSGWLSIRVVSSSTPATRGFEMELTEVEFIDGRPRITRERLEDELRMILGVRPTTGCFSMEAEHDAI